MEDSIEFVEMEVKEEPMDHQGSSSHSPSSSGVEGVRHPDRDGYLIIDPSDDLKKEVKEEPFEDHSYATLPTSSSRQTSGRGDLRNHSGDVKEEDVWVKDEPIEEVDPIAVNTTTFTPKPENTWTEDSAQHESNTHSAEGSTAQEPATDQDDSGSDTDEAADLEEIVNEASTSGSGGAGSSEGGDGAEKKGKAVQKREYRKGKQHKTYSLADKEKIVNMIEAGARTCEIVKALGDPESSVRNIRKAKSEVKKNIESAKKYFPKAGPSRGIRERSVKNHMLLRTEHFLLNWLTRRLKEKQSVDGVEIRRTARDYYAGVCAKKKVQNPPPFTASKGWLQRFKKRCSIKHASYQGEIASADARELTLQEMMEEEEQEVDQETLTTGDKEITTKELSNILGLCAILKEETSNIFKQDEEHIAQAVQHLEKFTAVFKELYHKKLTSSQQTKITDFFNHQLARQRMIHQGLADILGDEDAENLDVPSLCDTAAEEPQAPPPAHISPVSQEDAEFLGFEEVDTAAAREVAARGEDLEMDPGGGGGN